MHATRERQLTHTLHSDDNTENWFPDDMEACIDEDVELSDSDFMDPDSEYFKKNPGLYKEWLAKAKWEKLRKPRIPSIPFKDVDYSPKSDQRLASKFAASGLQIIVKMASIELTPEKPEFPAGGWHIEGQVNESICGTALYYLDSDNITDSNLSFRMQTSSYLNENDEFSVGQDQYHWMEQIYGTPFAGGWDYCLQNYGKVQTREGRLLAFPNVL